MANGRCRFHGGRSTGPRTAAGLERSREARLTHGFYVKQLREHRKYVRACFRRMKELLAERGL